jgi:uncharacterized protein (DUF362 family)/Pyruvate/2-oxoacid:ferredoxin oxidoreductase delta subunit
MSDVAIIRCGSYDQDEVRGAVKRGVELLGGAGAFVKKGEKILLKPNWIMAVPPERCATTHPAVFSAVCELFLAAGADLCYGDSPGAGAAESAALEAATTTGTWEIANRLGIPLADFINGQEIKTTSFFEPREFYIAKGALDCDGIISLPKLKTQGFLKLTGAVKNQFGCIVGRRKGAYHAQIHKPADFARMLLDLNAFLKPRLYIMDGVMAMEGNGPMNGDPKKMNVILLSADPIALDATVCRLVDLRPEYSYTVALGMQAGLGVYLSEDIRLLGDPLEEFISADFNIGREPISNLSGADGRIPRSGEQERSRPFIDEGKCKSCGVCVDMCPIVPKALSWDELSNESGDSSAGAAQHKQAPSYDYSRCIRCYCCQEFCPHGAIEIRFVQ